MEAILDLFIGKLSLAAMIIAWIIGVTAIISGRKKKNSDDVYFGLKFIVFGSIPFFNGFALMVVVIFSIAALIIAGLTISGKFIAEKITNI